MLFALRSLMADEQRALDRIDELRHSLRHYVVQNPRRWTGLLARMTRARALRASNSIEGINVSTEDAMAAVDNEDPADADKATWQAVRGYQAAMDYILQRCRDPNFRFSRDVLLAVHFMISQHDLGANPGNFRIGWVGVRNSETETWSTKAWTVTGSNRWSTSCSTPSTGKPECRRFSRPHWPT